MGITLGGRNAVDPKSLIRVCADRHLPYEHFAGQANLFKCPVGRGPGRGAVLLRFTDYTALDITQSFELVFDDGTLPPAKLQKIQPTKMTCVVPGTDQDPENIFLVDLVDRRFILFRKLINRAYNVRSLADGNYVTGTLSVGVPWTWQQLFADLWQTVGTSLLGATPTLPFTPHGTPEGWFFYGMSAWDALNDFVERMACVIVYDPFADTFKVKQAGVSTADAKQAGDTFVAGRLVWDTYDFEIPRAVFPEKLRVLFRTAPAPAEGSTVWTVEDIPISPAEPGGAEPGTIEEIYDDLYATTTNAATRHSRALERAADWVRVRTWYTANRVRMVQEIRKEAAIIPAKTIGVWSMRDNARGLQTEIGGGEPLLMKKPDFVAAVGGTSSSAFLDNVHVVQDYDTGGLPVGTPYFEKVEFPAGAGWPPVVSTPRVTYGTSGDGYAARESEERYFRIIDKTGGPVTHIEPAYAGGGGAAYVVFWKVATSFDLPIPDTKTGGWKVTCVNGTWTITPTATTYRFGISVSPPGNTATGLDLTATALP